MDLSGFLKNLKLDFWYMGVLNIGTFVFVLSLFFDVKGLTNGELQLLSGGWIFFGLGEWKNHKVASWIKPTNVYTGGPALMEAKVRTPDIFGIILDGFGIFLFSSGLVVIVIRLIIGCFSG